MKISNYFTHGDNGVMNKIRNLALLTLAILTFSVSDVSAQNFSSDKSARAVEQKVFKEINKLPYYGVFDHIAFSYNNGTVTLYGKVANAINRKSAERSVRDIPGVTNIVNNIEILPLGSFDNSIRRQALREFANKGLYRYLWEPNPSVRIIVDRGHVTLEGYVANRGDANLMNILANGVSGTFSVTNNLVVGRDNAR
ncbi:MAG: putative phosphoslipid binding protein [Acidobacteria bacterium]|jgi:hyperosmotically inducible protein|nr:putative phosphoslipid binding protein [Acidobacteriota bacterium]